jgi:rhodanese-related sulfurtransferase
MKALGVSIDPVNLVKPQYIGSSRGSSLAELRRAAEENGLHALAIGRLTPRSLRSCSLPLLLHVKRGSTSEKYDHYELSLGVEESGVKLFNPPELVVRLVPFRELASRWDGNALIVSRNPIDLAKVLAPARERFALLAAVAIAGVGFLRFAHRRVHNDLFASWKRRLGLSVGQGAMLGMVASVFAFGYHFAVDAGFLTHAGATESIQRAHAGDFISKVDADTVKRLLGADGAVLVDARYKRDFEAAHLKGSVNVPVNASDKERRETLANVAKNAKLVVYCQSADCQHAEKVAVKLKDDGYSNVSIFRGGWREWTARNHREKESKS